MATAVAMGIGEGWKGPRVCAKKAGGKLYIDIDIHTYIRAKADTV